MTQQRHSDTLQFADASFYPVSGRLVRDGQQIPLRPTTARLLAALLTAAAAAPAEVQTKDALIGAVWPRGRATEQSLFQAISELRRALAPLEAIVTVPNQGYRFALPVTQARARSWPRVSMAASVIFTVLAVVAGQGGPMAARSPAASVSPSLSAFARGVALLEANRPAEAESVFRAVLLETPSFANAQVLLGEALLAQGRLDDARDSAAALLASSDELDALSRVQALALMSRTKERAGRPGEALHFALAAIERAQREALACAAADIEDRLAALLDATGPDAPLRNSPWPLLTEAPEEYDRQVARDAAAPQARPVRCAQLRAPLPSPQAHSDGQGSVITQPMARIARRSSPFPSMV